MDARVALVWGGSRGIGAAVARRLAAEGFDIAFTSRGPGAGAERLTADLAAAGARVRHVVADAGRADAAERAVAETVENLGRLDAVVCSAGIFPYGAIGEMTAEQVEEAVGVHVRSPYLLARAAVPHLPAGGRIVSIGSTFAERAPYGGISLYATTKASLVGLTRSLARELGPQGVTVNLVQPGNVDTDMNPATSEEARLELPSIALGRYAHPDEVAAMVAFLVGEEGSYVTGAVLNVDGGLVA